MITRFYYDSYIKSFSLKNTIKKWIFELPKIGNKLPINEDELYIMVNATEGDVDIMNQFEDRINKYYNNSRAFDIIFGYSVTLYKSQFESKYALFNKSTESDRRKAVKFVYNKLSKLPKNWIDKALGSGMYGVVFNWDKDKILKIYFNGIKSGEKRFWTGLKNTPVKEFPKIYDVSDDYLLEEKLSFDKSNPKLKKYIKYINLIKDKRLPSGISNKIDEIKDKEFINWIDNILDTIGYYYGVPMVGDLHENNIGIRSNGDIVYSDPIGGDIANRL